MKHIHIYNVSRNYTRCQVAYGDRRTHVRIGTSTLTPDKGLTKSERRAIIAEWLLTRFGLRLPSAT